MLGPDWTKASRSNSFSNCVQARWRKSSYSQGTASCAEGRRHAGLVEVRDSKDPAGPVLRFTPQAWTAFLATLAGP